jgi:NADH dehydrogenase (ubiquinone) Fe-S protein 3
MLSKQLSLKYLKKNTKLIIYNNLGSILLYLKKYILNIKIINNELSIILKNNNSFLFILYFFKMHFKYQFKELIDICAVDYLNNNYLNNRFELNYMFLSLKYKTRLKIKLFCDEKIIIPSIIYLYSSAG